jgi:hypothetical protein
MTKPQGPVSVWDEVTCYRLPRVVLHQHSGQQAQCLEGLVEYAAQIATNKHSYHSDILIRSFLGYGNSR